MIWINFLHCYQPANSDAYKIKEAADFSYDKITDILVKNPQAKFTINISGCLILRLVELNYFKILDKINFLIDNGQVELTGSSAYHWLLPLINKSEVFWQIRENERIIKKYFPKAKLKGFFLPEMAYSLDVAKIIKKLGYSWIIVDEITVSSKKPIDFSQVYLDKSSNLKVIFRSREFSNCYPPEKIINLANKNNNQVVISATDGELYGFKHKDFSRKLDQVLKDKQIKTILVSDYIALFKKIKSVSLRPSNWESSEHDLSEGYPYRLWFDNKNKIHLNLWKLANLALALSKKYQTDLNNNWSRWHLLRGLSSCTFWWASEHDFKDTFGPLAWSPDEIERGLNEIIKAIRSLENSTSYQEKVKAENIFNSIKKLIWLKHWSNHYNNEQTKINMNKINKLFDEKYVLNFFKRKVLPLYPDFKKIEKIKIIYHKNYVWETTYHVVLEFKTSFSYHPDNSRKTKIKVFSFFCTAHSSEPRKNVYDTLNYLWGQGFSKGFLTIPKPLFYSKYFNASFYRGVSGDSLLTFIKNNDKRETEKIVKKTAEWLVKLHKTPISEVVNFNKKNNRIKTVIPGYHKILKEVQEKYGNEYFKDLKKIYGSLIELENDFFNLTTKRWLIHGDVHPDNIIKIGTKKMAMIDFADICASDFARDLGTFIQQLDYKLNRYGYSKNYISKIKKIFLETYCKKAKVKYNASLKERIKLYYCWTAIRTAVFWLLKYDARPDRAEELINQVKKIIK